VPLLIYRLKSAKAQTKNKNIKQFRNVSGSLSYAEFQWIDHKFFAFSLEDFYGGL